MLSQASTVPFDDTRALINYRWLHIKKLKGAHRFVLLRQGRRAGAGLYPTLYACKKLLKKRKRVFHSTKAL